MQKIIKTLVIITVLFFSSIKSADALMEQVLVVEDQESNKVTVQAGEKIEQAFVMPTDSFGIVTVNFILPERESKVKVEFKIKEKGEDGWIFEGSNFVHALDFYQDNGIPFPFGFPTIQNAKGIEYVFEIQPEEEITILETNGKIFFSVAREKPAKELVLNDLQRKIYEDGIFIFIWLIICTVFLFKYLKLNK